MISLVKFCRFLLHFTPYTYLLASPTTSQIIEEKYKIDAIIPSKGIRVVKTIDAYSLLPGWNTVEICIEGFSERVEVFCAPTGSGIEKITSENVFLQFELIEMLAKRFVVYCNGSQIGEIEKDAVTEKTIKLPIKNELLYNWISIQMEGDAVISTPQLLFDGKIIEEERVAKFESVRPEWFGNMKKLTWDIGRSRPMTPARFHGNRFFFTV